MWGGLRKKLLLHMLHNRTWVPHGQYHDSVNPKLEGIANKKQTQRLKLKRNMLFFFPHLFLVPTETSKQLGMCNTHISTCIRHFEIGTHCPHGLIYRLRSSEKLVYLFTRCFGLLHCVSFLFLCFEIFMRFNGRKRTGTENFGTEDWIPLSTRIELWLGFLWSSPVQFYNFVSVFWFKNDQHRSMY